MKIKQGDVEIDGVIFSRKEGAELLEITQSQLNHRTKDMQIHTINGMRVRRLLPLRYHRGLQTKCKETGQIFPSLPALAAHLKKKNYRPPAWRTLQNCEEFIADDGYHYYVINKKPRIQQSPRTVNNRMNYEIDDNIDNVSYESSPKLEQKAPDVKHVNASVELSARDILKNVAIDFIKKDYLYEAKELINVIEEL